MPYNGRWFVSEYPTSGELGGSELASSSDTNAVSRTAVTALVSEKIELSPDLPEK